MPVKRSGILSASLTTLAALVVGGCVNRDVNTLSNSDRAVLHWKKGDAVVNSCAEFTTPVAEKQSRTFEVKAPPGFGGSQIRLDASRDAAQIYNVSDILQFGHASLYRLCEAKANGFIQENGYETLFGKTISGVKELLEAQISAVPLQMTKTRSELYKRLDRERKNLRTAERNAAEAHRALAGQIAEVENPRAAMILRRELEEQDEPVPHQFERLRFSDPRQRAAKEQTAEQTAQQEAAMVMKRDSWKRAIADYQRETSEARASRIKTEELTAALAGLDIAIAEALSRESSEGDGKNVARPRGGPATPGAGGSSMQAVPPAGSAPTTPPPEPAPAPR